MSTYPSESESGRAVHRQSGRGARACQNHLKPPGNRFYLIEWNGRAGGGNNQRFRGGGGGRIATGDYLVRLKVDGSTFEQVLTVKNDPESPADRVGADEELEFWLDQFEGSEIDR